MPRLINSIIIEASIDSIWENLAEVDRLSQFDPGAKISSALTKQKNGLNAERRVEMLDGKNWFEEKCTVYEKNETLKYELLRCSFPVHQLNHQYYFRKIKANKYEVKQEQNYVMKYALVGQIMGYMLKPKWNKGVQGFLLGLKQKSESSPHSP